MENCNAKSQELKEKVQKVTVNFPGKLAPSLAPLKTYKRDCHITKTPVICSESSS